MAFCNKCGCEIQTGISFCSKCGNKIENLEMANMSVSAKNISTPIFKNKKIILAICAVAIALAIVIVCVTNINKESYEDVAKKYAIAVVRSDYEVAQECLPFKADDMFEYSDFDDYDDNELVVTAEIVRAYQINKSKIEDKIDEIDYSWSQYDYYIDDYIDTDIIDEAFNVKLELSVYEPHDDEDWAPATFIYTVVKYDGEWKVLTDFISDREIVRNVW